MQIVAYTFKCDKYEERQYIATVHVVEPELYSNFNTRALHSFVLPQCIYISIELHALIWLHCCSLILFLYTFFVHLSTSTPPYCFIPSTPLPPTPTPTTRHTHTHTCTQIQTHTHTHTHTCHATKH